MRTVRTLHRDKLGSTTGKLVLDYDERQKSRFVARLESGEELAVRLPRGTALVHGDCLLTEDGATFEIVAADEDLSVAATDDALLLARAAYHLGNRHVPLRIGVGILAYRHDHVLDAMMRLLGLMLSFRLAPFTPEPGAYGHAPVAAHGHGHGHDHSQHEHEHEHEHGHDGSSG